MYILFPEYLNLFPGLNLPWLTKWLGNLALLCSIYKSTIPYTMPNWNKCWIRGCLHCNFSQMCVGPFQMNDKGCSLALHLLKYGSGTYSQGFKRDWRARFIRRDCISWVFFPAALDAMGWPYYIMRGVDKMDGHCLFLPVSGSWKRESRSLR